MGIGIGTAFLIGSVLSVGATVATTVAANNSRNKASKAQKKLESLRAMQQRRAQIQEKKKLAGMAVNSAYQSGGGGDSGLAGYTGALTSQLAANSSFLDQGLQLSDRIADAQNKAQSIQAIGGAANSVINTATKAATTKFS